jgi:hypothetical protein
MANKTKNHHRDKKPHEPIPEDGGNYRDPDDGPGWASYYKQCQERKDRILAETLSTLAEEEARFFLTLAEVHGELSHGEVSEAARRVGSPRRRAGISFGRFSGNSKFSIARS